MACRIADLRNKEVINLYNGMRLGYIYDAEIDIENRQLVSIIVPGALKFFGFFGRYDDIIIPMDKIQKIGDDIIFVDYNFILPYENKKRKSFLNVK